MENKSNLSKLLAENISRLMKQKDGLNTVDQVAKRSGIGRGTVDRVKKAQVSTTIDTLEAFATAFGVTATSLLSKDGVELIRQDPALEHYVRFPLLDAPHGLGGQLAQVDYPEILQFVEVSEDWAKRELRTDHKNIKVVPCNGDSMEGTIENGSVAFIDISVRCYDGDGLYAIIWQGRVQIKRLQAKHDQGKIRIISDNKSCEPDWANDDLIISGKVLAAWNLRRF